MFDYKDTHANLQTWSSGWKSSTDGKVHTYHASPGSIDVIDNDTIRAIKEPLLRQSNGAWCQKGRRYLYDRKNKVFGAVFSTDCLDDIQDIVNNKCWQHAANCTQLEPGMAIYVVPNEKILKQKPNATGLKFKLA